MTIKNNSRICLILSAAIVAVALIMTLLGAGINLGADFVGGLNISYNMNQTISQGDVEAALKAQGISAYTIAYSGESKETLQILVKGLDGEEQIQSLREGLESALKEKYPNMDAETATANSVGPVADGALARNVIISLLAASVLILVYIALRFDVSTGLAAVFGLFHDVLVTLGFVVILRGIIQVNASSVAALLAVAGYSIINTIVLFSRILENSKKPIYKDLSRAEVVSVSVKDSLTRTISITLIMLIAIVVLYIIGAPSIRAFSLPIILGILCSAYSSNMISGYAWAWLEERRRERKRAKRKAKKA